AAGAATTLAGGRVATTRGFALGGSGATARGDSALAGSSEVQFATTTPVTSATPMAKPIPIVVSFQGFHAFSAMSGLLDVIPPEARVGSSVLGSLRQPDGSPRAPRSRRKASRGA